MSLAASVFFLCVLLLLHGCGQYSVAVELKHKAIGNTPQTLALYEAWFGQTKHIPVGYSTKNADTIRNQIRKAKALGISGFVVDWYGDREPFIDQSYAVIQSVAAKNNFNVALMYDEADIEEGATDQVIADLSTFHDTYMLRDSP